MPEDVEIIIHGISFWFTIHDTEVSRRLSWPLRSMAAHGAVEGAQAGRSSSVSSTPSSSTALSGDRTGLECDPPVCISGSASVQDLNVSASQSTVPSHLLRPCALPSASAQPSVGFPADGHPDAHPLTWSLIIAPANMKEFTSPLGGESQLLRWPDGTVMWVSSWGVMGDPPGRLSGRGGGLSFQGYPHDQRNMMTIMLWVLDQADQVSVILLLSPNVIDG